MPRFKVVVCEYCQSPDVVCILNGHPVCDDHYSEVWGKVNEELAAAMRGEDN